LYDRLSAERNLDFFARLYDVQDVPGQVERYLRLLGLWERRHEAAGELSKGMRQKLAIACALLHEPEALFLDEPTSGLDPEAAHLVREFIAELRHEGRTIFLCTHNLDEADRLCDRIAVFNTHLLALDAPAALRRQLYGRTVVFHLREPAPALTAVVQRFDCVHSVQAVDNKLVVTMDDPEKNNPALVRALVQADADIQFVGEVRRTLEDVYLRLVGKQLPSTGQTAETGRRVVEKG
jgi:ABC-2 type transport system ATP-binding protein